MERERIPLARKASLISRSEAGILAVYKPAGIKSHPNRKGEIATLIAPYDARRECFESPEGTYYHLCNRLDTPTAGILILAEREEIAKAIKSAFRQQRVEKIYLAAVQGDPGQASGTWEDTLLISKRGGKIRTDREGNSASGRGKLARTEFHVLDKQAKFGKTIALLRLLPKTGRSHQLRVQTSQRGLPILGDKTYGDFEFNKYLRKAADIRKLLLHAYSIRIPFPDTDYPDFSARTELPPWVIDHFSYREKTL